MEKKTKDLTEEDELLRERRKLTKKLYGKQADNLLEKMYSYFPELKTHIEECRQKNRESVAKAKLKIKEKRRAEREKKESEQLRGEHNE